MPKAHGHNCIKVNEPVIISGPTAAGMTSPLDTLLRNTNKSPVFVR